MQMIQSISAEELALLISTWGHRPEVQWQIDKTARLKIGHAGVVSFIHLYGIDERGRSNGIAFSAAVNKQIQFWHIEAWSRKTLFGRLRRAEDGCAEVDWLVPIEGVTEDYLHYCFDIWCNIVANFLKFCKEHSEIEE